ncbi:hypothetical protein MJI37_32900, partial [Salmonella enterica subsp. enterica serovar Cerro]|nr:hypothetical protein [Salmonella enterica subsp. enterica serovar Cerro]
EPSAADFTNVLRLTPVCCFSPGITHSIVVIISLYIDNHNEIIISTEECDLLARVIKAVLLRSIEQGGTTLKDFLQSDGKPGYFA